MKTKKDFAVVKWVYPSSGVPFSTKGYRKVIAKLEHQDDQERKRKRKWKGQMKQKGQTEIDGIHNWIQSILIYFRI